MKINLKLFFFIIIIKIQNILYIFLIKIKGFIHNNYLLFLLELQSIIII